MTYHTVGCQRWVAGGWDVKADRQVDPEDNEVEAQLCNEVALYHRGVLHAAVPLVVVVLILMPLGSLVCKLHSKSSTLRNVCFGY